MYTLMGFINIGIAVAFFTIGMFITPWLKITPRVAHVLATVFFLTCGLAHVGLAIPSFLHSNDWLVSPAMMIVQGAQLIVGWAFIAIVGPILQVLRLTEQQKCNAEERLRSVIGSR